MATNSSYLKLSSSILIEYQYRDQSAPGSNVYTTTAAPWFLMNNEHDNSIAVFNNDAQTNTTGNVRTRMGTPTDVTLSQFGYLTLQNQLALNDYDPKLTDTVNLPVTFAATQTVKYDTIRIHLTQGFNFENYEGFQIRLSFNTDETTPKKVRYLNIAYRKADNYAQINPNPFLFGGSFYASFIEIKIPALYNMIDEYQTAYNAGSPTSDLPIVKLGGGVAPDVKSLIHMDFAWIKKQQTINGQDYYYCYDFTVVDLPTLDQFADIGATAVQSTQGDYIELYATHSGSIIDNYITSLNQAPGNDYIILHELDVYEYLWPFGASAAIWKRTSGLEFIQDTNYDDPILYRPVIQNSGAIAAKLDYTVRLFNREDSSSIWKTASLIINNPAQYGRYLTRLNLGTNPIQPKVYNKIVDKSIKVSGINNNSDIVNASNYTAFVTSFLTANNVILSAQNAFLQRNPETGNVDITSVGNSQSEILYAQGLCKINLTNSDTFLKFVIYKQNNNEFGFMDLTGLGKIYLNFYGNSGEENSFLSFESPQVSQANGEILFKVPKKDAQRISEYTNKTFTITSDNGEAVSELYTGTFVKAGESNENFKDQKIANLETKIKELELLSVSKSELISLEQSKNSALSSTNTSLLEDIQKLQNSLDEKVRENTALLEDDALDEAEKAKLAEQIANLEATASSLESQVANAAIREQTLLNSLLISGVDPSTPQKTFKGLQKDVERRSSNPNDVG